MRTRFDRQVVMNDASRSSWGVASTTVRLAIVSALAAAEVLTFKQLKDMLGITDGNLSVHARRLEEAGYVASEKSFVARVPRTYYRLTEAGRAALDDYLNYMESVIKRVRER